MAMAAGAGAAKGAQALIMALNSVKTVKSTKAMLDNTKEMNKAFESGAMDSLNAVFQGMQNSAPVQSAFQVLFAQIQAATTEANVELMTSLLELFKSDGFKKALGDFTDFINWMISSATWLVDNFGWLFGTTDVPFLTSGGTVPDPNYVAPDPNISYSGGGGGGQVQIY